MASLGEEWVKKVLETQGYRFMDVGKEDILAIKDNIALVIEEKDHKYPIKVGKTRVYTIAGRKTFPFRLRQLKGQLFEVLERLRKANRFLTIIQICVVSSMLGRHVYVVRHYKRNIFFIRKSYFPVWLKHLEYVYLGTPEPFPNLYMGGK